MINIIAASIKISFKKAMQYKFESLMTLLYALFNLMFILVFWVSFSTIFILPNEYTNNDIYFFSSLVLLSSAINEIYFCNNCLPYDINDGTLDIFLIKPGNKVIIYLSNYINIISLLSYLLISLIFLIVTFLAGDYIASDVIIGIILLCIGVFNFGLLSAIIAMGSFWYGIVDSIRNILFSFEEMKKYPMGIFPNIIRTIFTVVIPLSLITYYPFEISIGHMSLSLSTVLIYFIITLVLLVIFNFVLKKGLNHYESNN